jgi:hypothetical protein
MSTSETPADTPAHEENHVDAPAADAVERRRPRGRIVVAIAAAIVLVAVGFGVGWFGRASAEPKLGRVRGLRRALAVIAAVRLVTRAVRAESGCRHLTKRCAD